MGRLGLGGHEALMALVFLFPVPSARALGLRDSPELASFLLRNVAGD